MADDFSQIDRLTGLNRLEASGCSTSLQIFRASYQRQIPSQYQTGPYIRPVIDLNVVLTEGSRLIIPASPRTNFYEFYTELRKTAPAVFRQILAPSGAAKSAASGHITPIKQITQLTLAGRGLPGDEQLYGWSDLAHEAAVQGMRLELFFQGNGLYYNRGSVFYDGQELHAYPDAFLAELLEEGLPDKELERLAVSESSLKRPLVFFASLDDGKTVLILHTFLPEETYRQGMVRLRAELRRRRVRSALAASPPLVLPDEQNNPRYLPLGESIRRFAANDVRHYLLCPYEGAVLLSAELGRAQSLRPDALADSISGGLERAIDLELAEALGFFPADALADILNRKGYAGRFAFSRAAGKTILSMNPLAGVYSHLVVFVTRQGRFGLIQTSGTRGNITGNDGPTYDQLQFMLRDLNEQSPFEEDPIIAAASGSQGNDVPNVLCRGVSGEVELLHVLAPQTRLDEILSLRGVVTTPRVGIGIPISTSDKS